MCLSGLRDGQDGTVREIHGGHGFVQRLAEMGVRAGLHFRIVRGGGPVILEFRGQRLVVGHGMARRIFVDPA